MAQLTNLNIAPYYDDYSVGDDFHRVLFRPGFSIQARELTTLQSILQNQVETLGSHMFKEGAVVIPGQVSYSDAYYSVKLSPTFANEQIRLSQYINYTDPVIATGETSGVQAKIVSFQEGSSSRAPYLYGTMLKAGNDATTVKFKNGENISVNIDTQHVTSYSSGVSSLKTAINSNPNISCVQIGSAVTVESGVYFIRGQFVRNAKQTLVLSPNSNRFNARVGFVILEKLETPESDISLTDNSTGSTNYAAKGAHRLKLRLRLKKIPLGAVKPNNFVELIQIRNGVVVKESRTTDYSIVGDELARRTYDQAGDFTTKPFTFKVQEQIDNDYKGLTYKGAYGVATGASIITDDNVLAAEFLLNLQISTGKAYVKGYEVEKIAPTNLTIHKARAFNTVNAGVSTFNVGNFANITNIYGLPDIGNITGETTPYKEIGIFTDFTTTRGDATSSVGIDGLSTTRGFKIGVCRARAFEFGSGTQGNQDAIYKTFLFDVRMLTFLRINTVSDFTIAAAVNVGAQVTGATSGATGFVYIPSFNSGNAETEIHLTNVIGTFSVGEKIKISDSAETDKILETSSNVDVTISSVIGHRFEEARSLFMGEDGDGQVDFSADLVLALVDDEGKILLDGTDENALDEFNQMLTDGESVVFETQRVAKLIEPEKNISVFKLPKNTIKTLLTNDNSGASDTQFTVRRQFIGLTNSSGVVSFSATGSNETFVGFTATDYIATVLTAGGGSAIAGDVILLNSTKVTGTTTSSLTITDSTLLGSSAKVKVIATILKTGVTSKTKTTNLCKQLKVLATDVDGAYGIRATDRDISLGRADVYKLIAVYDSEATDADATVPSMTLTSATGTFLRGEKVVGINSGAQGRIITTVSPMSYALEGNAGAINFVAGEVITGASSRATATVGVVTKGSRVITSRFTLDTGQRDNYYDIARITRKIGKPVPLGRLLVVYDFLEHGSGDVFTVDSYNSLNGQMEYDNIPIYTGTKVDPDAPEPVGTFPLRDCFDFRPTIKNVAGTSVAIATTDQITAASFNFGAREFSGTGGVVVESPKPTSSLQADFEFYVGIRATISLTRGGKFELNYGVSDENPKYPKDIPDALKLASITIPPYTFSPNDVKVTRYKTQRFTMRDIGKIKDRVERLEDLTALTLLELSAESFEVQDQNGLNRFKSGFFVDNFKGHKVGAALNPDYKVAVDIINGELRPKCVIRNIKLIESKTNDADRASRFYRKTGALITLPYQTFAMIAQDFGTKYENVMPYESPSWIGNITLIPAGDDWFDDEILPKINNSVMGTYDTVLAANVNSLGTFWNVWEICSVGVNTSVTQDWSVGYATDGYTETTVSNSIDTTTTTSERAGVTNTLVEDIVTTNDLAISTQIIPFARSRKIAFTGECFLPGKRVYPFFDGIDVSAFTEPLNADYTNVAIPTGPFPEDGGPPNQGLPLVTNSAGKIEGFFTIPQARYAGQENVPKFETQKQLQFRLTSSPTNARIGLGGTLVNNATAGQVNYAATGLLELTQETVTSTRNASIVQTSEAQTTVVVDTGSSYVSNTDEVFVYVAPTIEYVDVPYAVPYAVIEYVDVIETVINTVIETVYLPAIPDTPSIAGPCIGLVTPTDVVLNREEDDPVVTTPPYVPPVVGNELGRIPNTDGSPSPVSVTPTYVTAYVAPVSTPYTAPDFVTYTPPPYYNREEDDPPPQPSPSYETGGSSYGSYPSGCFVAGTMVEMADGTTKAIETIDIGENTRGGIVLSALKFMPERIYDYKGVKVSGSHYVMEDNQFISVENSKHGIVTDMHEVVYNFIVTGYRIFIEGIEFGAYYTQDPDTYADWDAGMQRLNEELRDGK